MISVLRALPAIRTVAVAILIAATSVAAPADTVYLKDNRQLTGQVDDGASDADRLMIRTASGSVPIPRGNIERIEREDPGNGAKNSADKALAGGDMDKALELYLVAYRETPDEPELQQQIADLRSRIEERDNRLYGVAYAAIEQMLEAGRHQDAIDEARRHVTRAKQPSAAKRFNQLIARGHIGMARQFKDRVDYLKAEEHYHLAIGADPEGPLACFELADMLQLSPSRKTDAIPFYQKGIEVAANEPGLMDEQVLLDYEFRVGQLYIQSHEYVLAADIFLSVARKDTSLAYPQAFDRALDAYTRITALNEVPNIEHIVNNLKSITQTQPDNQRAALLLGRIYFERNDWHSARDVLSDAVRAQALTDSNVMVQEAIYFLGISHRRLGDDEQAAGCFQMLVNRGVASYDAICELADIRLKQGSYQRALDLFAQARAKDREKYRAYLGLGEALRMLERYPEARENYREVVLRDENNVQALLSVGKTYFQEDQMEDAIASAQKSIDGIHRGNTRNTPETDRRLEAEAYTLIGEANMNLNLNNMSREQFNNALKSVPEYAPALDGVGKTYQAEGFHQKAQTYFERAIEADPRNPDYRLSLAISYHKYLMNTAKALPNYLTYLELGGKDPNVKRWIADCGGTLPEQYN
jgi:tetratricopeptide (TPR) repeat protein